MVHGLVILCFILYYNRTTATQYNSYTSIYIYTEGLSRRRPAPLPQNHVRSGALLVRSLFSWLCGGHQQWPFIYNALWAQLGVLLWGKEACMQIFVPFHCHAACWLQCAWLCIRSPYCCVLFSCMTHVQVPSGEEDNPDVTRRNFVEELPVLELVGTFTHIQDEQQ